MKKFYSPWVAVAGLVFLFFAQAAAVASVASSAAASSAAQAVLAAEKRQGRSSGKNQPMTFAGVVISKSTVVSTQGKKRQLEVMDRWGIVSIFIITADTLILEKDGTSATLDWIGQNDKVAIEYTLEEDGTKIAKSVRRISDFSSER